MLKLKLQYFGHLMPRADSLEWTLMLGKTEGGRRRGQQRVSCLDGITDSVDMNLSKLWKIEKDRETDVLQSMRSQIVRDYIIDIIVRHDLATEQQYSIFHMYCIFFILSSANGRLGCFYETEVCMSLNYGFLRIYAQ